MKFITWLLVAVALAAIGSGALEAQEKSVEIPDEVEFINLTESPLEGQLELRSGHVFVRNLDGEMQPSQLAPLASERSASYTGNADTILGAPAIIFTKAEIDIPKALQNAGGALMAANSPSGTVFIQELRSLPASGKEGVITTFVVSSQKSNSLEEIGRFSFKENTFNQYLSEVWPLSKEVLAIVTRSSRHSYVNTLFLFNLEKHQVVGMREFSVFQYLPAASAFWMCTPVVNCDNINEIITDAKRDGVVVKVFNNGVVSDDFKPVEEIGGDVEKAKEPSPEKLSSDLTPKSRETVPTEKRPQVAQQSEQPTAMPSLWWAIFIFLAVVGLIWFLLRRHQ